MQERHLHDELKAELGQASDAPQATPTPASAKKQGVPVWLWIGLAGGMLGMCVLCGGALAVLGVVGALSTGQSAHPTAWQTAPTAPDTSFYPPSGAGNGGMDWGSSGYAPMPNYNPEIGTGSYPDLSGGDSLSDSIRQHSA
ncbi:MAG: hypothetical protein ACK4UU_05030, partial [Fimbriimonadales bacterium]